MASWLLLWAVQVRALARNSANRVESLTNWHPCYCLPLFAFLSDYSTLLETIQTQIHDESCESSRIVNNFTPPVIAYRESTFFQTIQLCKRRIVTGQHLRGIDSVCWKQRKKSKWHTRTPAQGLAISFPEPTSLLVSTKTRSPCLGADQKTRGLWERDWRSGQYHGCAHA